MPKSFCSGCKHWKWLRNFNAPYVMEGFHYCEKYGFKLEDRKELCNRTKYESE